MLPHSFARSSILMHILDPALRSLALGAAAAIVVFIFRVKNPSARLTIWKGVLYAALAMPLLALAVPAVPFPVPESIASLFANSTAAAVSSSSQTLAAPAVATNSMATLDIETAPATSEPLQSFTTAPPASARTIRRARHAEISAPMPSVADANTTVPSTQSAHTIAPVHAAQSAFPWAELAGVIFALVALFLLARIALGAIFGHRLVRSAETIADCDALRVLMRQARSAGVVSPPRLAESDVISVPVTLGILRPVILLPTYWRKWDEPTLRAVIAHEMSHIARRDALTQRLALIHRAVFWFSPLSWWLNLALADAAEEASDEAALLAGADRAFYATTLLNFFAALSQNSRRVYWQGVSMAAPGQADRRVDRILNWKGAVSMRIRKSLAVALAVVGVPAILLAAAARPSTQTEAPVAPPAPVAPAFPANPPAAPLPAPNPQPLAVPAPEPAVPMLPSDAAPVLGQVAPAAPLPPPAIAQVPPAPQAPVVAPAPPDAPFVVVTPNISIDDGQMQLQMKEFNKNIQKQMNAAQRKSLRDMQKPMALNLNFKAMPQLSPEDQAKLQDLEQQLANLSAKFTKDSPQMLQLQQQIAELKSHLDMSISKMIATGPFLYQVGPTARINVGDFGDRFVIVSDDSPIIMSGNSQDVEHATALRSKINGDFIWFQRDEKSYIIKDQATVNQAEALFKPEQELGAKQQDLGKQMKALGDQMRDQGQKMRDVHVTIPDLSADMEKLEAQMKQLSASGGTQQQLGDLQRQLGELMRKLGQNQNQAGEQQRQIGEQQRQLGDQMRTLGDQMRELGRQQRDASRTARDQLKQLLDNAVTKGTAQPE
ncbi:MAG TPA: M56 family metallopeptidase [Candidatus Acidoferrum sp.]|nr:M56 family metallopeptidase [Candidatus Acidoferrum sp.]